MKHLLNKFQELLSNTKLRNQLNLVYMVGFFIPMACIGIFLILNTSRLLSNYHKDLINSNNLRSKAILSEITDQVYTLSEDIVFNDTLQDLLSGEYQDRNDFIQHAIRYDDINDVLSRYMEIEKITVYSENDTLFNYEHFIRVNDQIKKEEWYQKAISTRSVFWTTVCYQDKYNNNYYNLCLVRQIPLLDKGVPAVLMMKLSENYLKIRLESEDYQLLLLSDDGQIFYSSDRQWYNLPKDFIHIEYDENYYQWDGQTIIGDENYMTSVLTLKLYLTENRIYVCTLDNSAYNNINQILTLCLIIIVLAVVLPFLLIRFFTIHFSKRVETLREAMHRASNENYDVPTQLMGEDEISQAFTDLLKMVTKIKEKDAKMYEARINTQRLQNAQQRIEMEVLASQINPHFLYNTLETIRMKAFKAGDRDVATAIKMLGKVMRYVLENTGTSSTTLKNELDYIETYLQIQKLRFTDKINYSLIVEEGLNTEEQDILPLLIQPIVENAIIHGLEEVEKGGLITIEVYTDKKELLYIDITDNGCGMTAETLRDLRKKLDTPHLNPSKNIGLYNINQRIRLCYGNEYGITIESIKGSGTKVSLMLPLTINNEAE